jgi:5-methylcytosine-specific restriction protein A
MTDNEILWALNDLGVSLVPWFDAPHPGDLFGAAPSERSPQWDRTRKLFAIANPFCAACGGKIDLQVHHCRPFHLYPELELVQANLIVLCENKGRHCHLRIGHSWDWKAFNPNVCRDAQRALTAMQDRLYE